MPAKNHNLRLGSAAIQMLVALAIAGTFAGVALAKVQDARQKQAQASTLDNLKQCAIAVHNSYDVNRKIPPYYGAYGGKTKGTFHFHLLPYLERLEAWQKEDNSAVVPEFLSSEDSTRVKEGAGAVNYPVNLRLAYIAGGAGHLSGLNEPLVFLKLEQIIDGTSNTLLFATRYQVCGEKGGSLYLDPVKNEIKSPTAATFGASMGPWQVAPKKADCNPTAGTAISFKEKAITVALCDASVRTVAVGISKETWQAVHTYGARDVPGKDWND